jgi:hypothetical protein
MHDRMARDWFYHAGVIRTVVSRSIIPRSDAFLDECTYQGAIPRFLPLHTSNQTQALDLGVLAWQKAEANRIRPGSELNPQTCQIVKMLGGLHKATTPANVIRESKCSGIYVRWSSQHGALLVYSHKEVATKVCHWKFSKVGFPSQATSRTLMILGKQIEKFRGAWILKKITQ